MLIYTCLINLKGCRDIATRGQYLIEMYCATKVPDIYSHTAATTVPANPDGGWVSRFLGFSAGTP